MKRFLADIAPWRLGFDRLAIGYTLLSGVLPLLNPSCFDAVAEPGPLHTPLSHLVWHLALAGLVYVAPAWLRSRPWWPARLAGLMAVPLLFPTFYTEIEFLGVIFRDYGHSFDPVLIDLEQWIFGMQPSIEWSRAWPWPWLLELMEFAYFSYYAFGFMGLALIWYGSGRSAARNWSLSAQMIRDLTAVMLSCYLWYIAFPVWGPKYFDYIGVAGNIASEGLDGWIFTDIMRAIHEGGALHGAAFPSSHVAGSMVSWWWIWKCAPRHRWWLTTLWALLCLSIVYCRYHYVIDLVAGVAWGALIMRLTARYMPMAPEGLLQDAGARDEAPAGRRGAA
jgi:membrane-associated phospholipid phosphatase